MRRFIFLVASMGMMIATDAGVTTHLTLDCRTAVRTMATDGEALLYDTSWYDNATIVKLYDNGSLIGSGTKGTLLWTGKVCGDHMLTLKALSSDGSQVGLETAFFEAHKVEAVAATAATCTATGCTAGTRCSVCGAVLSGCETIAALGHMEVITTAAKDPTCTAAGCTKGSYCSRCNAVLSVSEVVAALGHNLQATIAAVAATCTTAGRTAEIKCSRCGLISQASATIPALGHTEIVTTAAKEPTCMGAGCTKGSYCSRCNAVLATSETITALGHAEVVTTAAEEATCTAAGCTKGSYCSRCNAVLSVSEVVAALGHNLQATIAAVAATCITAGRTAEIKCSRCGLITQPSATIAALGHSGAVTVPAVEPTSSTAGSTAEIRCSRCNELMQAATEIPALGYIRNVTARQLWPHKKVGVEFTVADDVGNITNENAKLVLQCEVGGEIIPAERIYGDMTIAKGRHHVIWDLEAQGVTIKTPSAKFRVGIADADDSDTGLYTDALYCVIDLSNGSKATSYPVTYLSGVPSGGWSDEYKTSKLVLRYIAPGTFVMGSPEDEYIYAENGNKLLSHKQDEIQHEVTLTQGFWIGVFEVTQRQYELVMGEKPSYFSNASYYAKRPVERVSYNDLRGSSYAGWTSPPFDLGDWDSFIGRMRKRTGIAHFDLPTEAQWEYACRAGTSSAINSGGVGRCSENSGINKYTSSSDCSAGTAEVGSYGSNGWGLYDMHGNVFEWCYDIYGTYGGSASDPYGASSGSYRVQRGGGWKSGIISCRSAARCGLFDRSHTSNYVGFRLGCWAELVRKMK